MAGRPVGARTGNRTPGRGYAPIDRSARRTDEPAWPCPAGAAPGGAAEKTRPGSAAGRRPPRWRDPHGAARRIPGATPGRGRRAVACPRGWTSAAPCGRVDHGPVRAASCWSLCFCPGTPRAIRARSHGDLRRLAVARRDRRPARPRRGWGGRARGDHRRAAAARRPARLQRASSRRRASWRRARPDPGRRPARRSPADAAGASGWASRARSGSSPAASLAMRDERRSAARAATPTLPGARRRARIRPRHSARRALSAG